jgi:hypothetical protein
VKLLLKSFGSCKAQHGDYITDCGGHQDPKLELSFGLTSSTLWEKIVEVRLWFRTWRIPLHSRVCNENEAVTVGQSTQQVHGQHQQHIQANQKVYDIELG